MACLSERDRLINGGPDHLTVMEFWMKEYGDSDRSTPGLYSAGELKPAFLLKHILELFLIYTTEKRRR